MCGNSNHRQGTKRSNNSKKFPNLYNASLDQINTIAILQMVVPFFRMISVLLQFDWFVYSKCPFVCYCCCYISWPVLATEHDMYIFIYFFVEHIIKHSVHVELYIWYTFTICAIRLRRGGRRHLFRIHSITFARLYVSFHFSYTFTLNGMPWIITT